MAYAAVVTVTNLGKRKWLATVVESDCSATDEAVIVGIPSTSRLLTQVVSLISGTGTTVNPVLGSATNPSGIDLIVSNETAASSVNNIASPAIPFVASANLFARSNPDAGADNVIHTKYIFLAGWE